MFHTGDSINAKDDATIPGQVNFLANGVKFAAVTPDGKLNLYPVANAGTGLQTDATGRVPTANA